MLDGGSARKRPKTAALRKLLHMVERIHALEDALQVECQSDHPLLAPELRIRDCSPVEDGDGERMEAAFGIDVTVSPVKSGTLMLSSQKGELFLGTTAVEVRTKLFTCNCSSSLIPGCNSLGVSSRDLFTLSEF